MYYGVQQMFFAIDPNPPQRRKRLENADISGKRILVVEDNELNIEIAEYILKEAGASVEKAENGKAALEQYQISEEGYYDAILMDLMMPVMDGYEAAKQIRSLNNVLRLPQSMKRLLIRETIFYRMNPRS